MYAVRVPVSGPSVRTAHRGTQGINTLLSVSGTVIRTGQIKMLQSRREYRCAKCEHRFTLTADLEQRHQMPIPDECPSHNAKPCRSGKFEFVEGTEVCKDYQEVPIQEQIHPLTTPPYCTPLLQPLSTTPQCPLSARP